MALKHERRTVAGTGQPPDLTPRLATVDLDTREGRVRDRLQPRHLPVVNVVPGQGDDGNDTAHDAFAYRDRVTDPRCSFCQAPDPVREYPVSTAISTTSPVSGRTDARGDGPWAACAACAALVDGDRFGDLLERSLALAPEPAAERSDPLYGFAKASLREQRADLFAQVAVSHGPGRPLGG